MSNKKLVRYNLDNIDKIGARFNLIYGERSNGKSYQVKHKKAVEKYLKTGRRFILMRRWKEEISSEKIEQYFQDVDVEKLTNGKYNCITLYRKCLYLSKYDNETGKTKRHEKIGYVVALSTEQNYAGASYLDVDDIIFEEFMSRSIYIANESNKLMNFYATVDRKRLSTRLWLVGNTISRVCPYINDWGLHQLISSQKQGTIKTIDIKGVDEKPIKIAIEYCKSTGQSSGTIGTNANMINTGAWETSPQPHLPKSYNNYKVLFRFGFQYQSFKFLCEYLLDKETNKNPIWFIYPFFKEFENNIIVFSDIIKVSKYWQRDIYNISIKNEKIRNLLMTFKENKIFYASDLCGTDFKQVIDFQIRR